MVTPRSTATWPSSGASSPVIIRNSVVLPAPLGPTRPTFSPRSSDAEASMNRIWWPICLEMLSRRIMLDGSLKTSRPLESGHCDCVTLVNFLIGLKAARGGFERYLGERRIHCNALGRDHRPLKDLFRAGIEAFDVAGPIELIDKRGIGEFLWLDIAGRRILL